MNVLYQISKSQDAENHWLLSEIKEFLAWPGHGGGFIPASQPRVRPRFFDQVGHETIYASSGNKHFSPKSCHRQTYQNYEQPPGTFQNSDFQSQNFSVLKIG